MTLRAADAQVVGDRDRLSDELRGSDVELLREQGVRADEEDPAVAAVLDAAIGAADQLRLERPELAEPDVA